MSLRTLFLTVTKTKVMTYRNELNGDMFTTNEGIYYALSLFKRTRPATTLKDVVKVTHTNGNR